MRPAAVSRVAVARPTTTCQRGLRREPGSRRGRPRGRGPVSWPGPRHPRRLTIPVGEGPGRVAEGIARGCEGPGRQDRFPRRRNPGNPRRGQWDDTGEPGSLRPRLRGRDCQCGAGRRAENRHLVLARQRDVLRDPGIECVHNLGGSSVANVRVLRHHLRDDRRQFLRHLGPDLPDRRPAPGCGARATSATPCPSGRADGRPAGSRASRRANRYRPGYRPNDCWRPAPGRRNPPYRVRSCRRT